MFRNGCKTKELNPFKPRLKEGSLSSREPFAIMGDTVSQ